jgi:hypothetical protein
VTRNVHVRTLPQWEGTLHLRGCSFHTGSLGAANRAPQSRLQVRNVNAVQCRVDSTIVGPVLFEDVRVDGLRLSGALHLPGCAFVRCTLRGRIGRVLAYAEPEPLDAIDSPVNQAFIRANEAVHAACEWALDVTEAECVELDIRGVPPQKIRINDEVQVCVSYERAAAAVRDGLVARMPLGDIVVASVSQRSRYPMDFILSTHRRHRSGDEYLDLFAALRDLGLTRTALS